MNEPKALGSKVVVLRVTVHVNVARAFSALAEFGNDEDREIAPLIHDEIVAHLEDLRYTGFVKVDILEGGA